MSHCVFTYCCISTPIVANPCRLDVHARSEHIYQSAVIGELIIRATGALVVLFTIFFSFPLSVREWKAAKIHEFLHLQRCPPGCSRRQCTRSARSLASNYTRPCRSCERRRPQKCRPKQVLRQRRLRLRCGGCQRTY